MMNEIQSISRILKIRGKDNLGDLLNGAAGEIKEGRTFGDYQNSMLSSYVIFSPLEQFVQLKDLDETDLQAIKNAVLDVYPPEDDKPEITQVKFKVLNETEPLVQPTNTASNTIRIFLSYSSTDKLKAGEVKSCLDSYGFDTFLAHEDIQPTREWELEIEQTLKSTDIFIPLISKHYHSSLWTDQETGIAVALQKLIIPVSIDTNPYGFIGKYQALRLTAPATTSCQQVVELIGQKTQFQKTLIDMLIRGLSQSRTFKNAEKYSGLLKKFKNSVSNDQANNILEAAVNNNQVYGSYNSVPLIKFIIAGKVTNPEILDRFTGLTGQSEEIDYDEITF